jgi:type II secretory pathway component PulF
MAIRMLRIGEETGQLPVLSGNVAEFAKAGFSAVSIELLVLQAQLRLSSSVLLLAVLSYL